MGERIFLIKKKKKKKDFSGVPVDKNPPANAGDGGSDPWFWKIPHASG